MRLRFRCPVMSSQRLCDDCINLGTKYDVVLPNALNSTTMNAAASSGPAYAVACLFGYRACPGGQIIHHADGLSKRMGLSAEEWRSFLTDISHGEREMLVYLLRAVCRPF